MFRQLLLCALAGPGLNMALAEEADPNSLDWLSGCWRSETGETREIWSESEDGYLFGYSVVETEGHVVFFEQMRIDPAPLPIFNAYPRGDGPSAFPAIAITDDTVTFANAAHDFPQKIKYWREGERLRATISRIDDGAAAEFHFVPCRAD